MKIGRFHRGRRDNPENSAGHEHGKDQEESPGKRRAGDFDDKLPDEKEDLRKGHTCILRSCG